MEMKEVTSSNVAAMGYDPGDPDTDVGTLLIRFNNGATYEYSDIPAFLAEELFEADSVGRFVNVNIRGKYEGKKLVEDEDEE